jgi:hypothetical protein
MNKELDVVHAIIICEGCEAKSDPDANRMKAAHAKFTTDNKVFLENIKIIYNKVKGKFWGI